MRSLSLCRVLLAISLVVVSAQEAMSNEGVIKLVKSGMSEDLIVNVIRQQPGSYVLGANELVALKESGVSERLIAAMLEKGKSESSAPAAGGVKVGGPSKTSGPGTGVYYKKNNEYFELITEDVEWKTSGALTNIASAGIVKKDLNGQIAGSSSRNFLSNPMEVVITPPSGITINSYILLPLTGNKGARAFKVGPVNQKSGLAKGAIAFGVEKVGEGSFRMVLPTPLGPGEYGILAVVPTDPASTASKMFTFRILI